MRGRPSSVSARSSGSNDRMYVGVETQLLVPGMQHDCGSQDGSESALGKPTKGCGRAGEKQPKHDSGSESRKRAQLGWYREDDVKVWNIEQAFALPVDPLLLRERLALGTMPIAARVVGGVFKTAALTDIEMSAERGGATPSNIRQHPALSGAEPGGLFESHPPCSNDIGKVEARRPSSGRHGLAPARLR